MLLCNEIIEKNGLNRDISEKCNLNCLIRQEANAAYNIYVFIMQVTLEKELNENWEKLINNISFSFQSKLKLDIEKWNIYTIFLVQEKVSDNLKYRIEQDKFATRKIILDSKRQYGDIFENPKDEINQIVNLINKKFFKVTIHGRDSDKEDNFKQLINEKSKIYSAVLESDNRVETLLDIYRKLKRGNL